VYVLWHAPGSATVSGEVNRAVFVAVSRDDGKSFVAEQRAIADATGACGCCGMKAFVDATGALFAVFRTATAEGSRDMELLVSRDQGKSFRAALLEKWPVKMCPMSSSSIAGGKSGVKVAWESQGQISVGAVDAAGTVPGARAVSEGRGAKHPALVSNGKGETLAVWTLGTGWQRGGTLAWEILDAAGRPTNVKGRADGVPVWGLPAAFVSGEGFTVMY
jgi:hypothetical protein